MPDSPSRRRPFATLLRLVARSLVLVPGAALAHEGHGHVDARLIAHYLTESEHLVWLGAAAVVVYGVRARRQPSRQSTRG